MHLHVVAVRISPILLLALGLCSADLSDNRREFQPDSSAFPASLFFDMVSVFSTFPFTHTLHSHRMTFFVTYVSLLAFPHPIFAKLVRSPIDVYT